MIPNTLPDQVADIYGRLAEIERRARNRKRTGTIVEVGTGENAGKYRVQLSEQGEQPYLSPWMKSRTIGAAGVKFDITRTVGEQVDVVSESGDLTDAVIDMSTYSDENARENTSNVPVHVTVGSTVFKMSGDNVTITSSSGHLN